MHTFSLKQQDFCSLKLITNSEAQKNTGEKPKQRKKGREKKKTQTKNQTKTKKGVS